MPELPEVETTVRQLTPHLPGCSVTSSWLRYKSLYRRGSLSVRFLTNRRFVSVERIGKNVLFRFRPSALMVINFGMTGQLVLCEPLEKPNQFRQQHLHCRFRLSKNTELRYYDARRFGFIFIAESCDFLKDLNIGPDPFQLTAASLKKLLSGRKAPIKPLLMNQRMVSGLGNIYVDETLFYSRIDPKTSGSMAARHAGRILARAQRVLTQAIEQGGSTILSYRKRDGSKGEFQRFHAVYGREGEPCVKCSTPIKKIVLQGRSTHFCPSCQKLPDCQ
jgi:formamidopyrimidine-DNA glycosylase